MDRPCSFLDCSRPSVALLARREWCLIHFITACYRELEVCSERGSSELEEGQRRMLIEIVDQVTSLSLGRNDFVNQERGQLMDILLWTSDLLVERD